MLASAFASLSVALWAIQYAGYLPAAYLRGPVWHAHEMLFGYTMAVIAGFLFTAVRNWTQQPTPAGAALMGFTLLWICGRVLVLTPLGLAAGLVNAAFPIAVAVGIAVPLVRSGNRRNYFFIGLLAAVGLAALALHLSLAGVIDWPARASLRAGLDLVLFIVAVVGGRVIPMFTNNGVPGAGAERWPWVERLSLGSVLAVLAADIAGMHAMIIASLTGLAAIAHAVRLALWRPWRSVAVPMVWVLHAAYAWIVIHLSLRALAALGLADDSAATHALTIGVIGGMTIGMMTRTARGHTGRALAADRYEIGCYLLVHVAAVVRVFGPMAWPAASLWTIAASALCWSAAFATYAVRYWPILSRARADARPG